MKTILIFLLLLSASGFAQQKKLYVLGGYITNEEQIPLPNATVRLYTSSSPIVSFAAITDRKGYFEIKIERSKDHYLTVTHTRYKILKISREQIDTAKNGMLGYIRLTGDGTLLKQVTIRAKQPIVQQMTDRTVITVNDQVKKMADNALDIIRLAPGMTISDNEDAILMSGKDVVDVMINDKMVKMTSRDLVKLLKSLPVNMVNQLQIMSNPSSKYDVAGNTGLLNIKTKQNVVKGILGNMDLSHSQAKHSMGDVSTNLTHGAGKFVISPYVAYHYGNYPVFTSTFRKLVQSELYQNSRSSDKWSDPALRINAEYNLSPKQIIGALIGYEASHNSSFYQTSSLFDHTTLKDTTYQNNGYGPNVSHWKNYNLNYRFTDTAGTDLSFDLDRSLYHKNDQNNVSDNISPVNTSNGNIYQTLTAIIINTFKGDYAHTWKNKIRLELGFKISGVNTNNLLTVNSITNGISTIDKNQSNTFLYMEYVNAAYINVAKNYGSWGAQFGLRAEHSHIRGISTDVKDNQKIKPDSSYTNLLPAVYLTYTPSVFHAFRLSFNQRIKRPNYNSLQPFTYQVDAFDYQTGNPALRVQKNSNAELSYTYNNTITLTSSYMHTTDFFNPVMYRVGNNIYQTTFNSGIMDNWNFNLNYPVKVAKWWNMLNKINGFYNHFNGSLYQGILNEGKWSYVLSTSQRITLPYTYLLLISARYSSPLQNLIYYQQSNANVSVNISKKILKDQGSIRIGVSDLFKMQRTNTLVDFGDLKYTRYETWESRRISLGVTWRFGNKKIKETHERSTGDKDEKSRSGN